ncbi:MAG: hypothetical protein ACOCZ5_00790 [bacterium]
MTKRKVLIGLSIVQEVGALGQAAVWGLSSALASKLTQDKQNPKTEEEKKKERKKNLKNMAISGTLGAAAGAAGHYLGNK